MSSTLTMRRSVLLAMAEFTASAKDIIDANDYRAGIAVHITPDANGAGTVRLAASNRVALAVCNLIVGDKDTPLISSLQMGKSWETGAEEYILPVVRILPALRGNPEDMLFIEHCAYGNGKHPQERRGKVIVSDNTGMSISIQTIPAMFDHLDLVTKVTREALVETCQIAISPQQLMLFVKAAKKLGIPNPERVVIAYTGSREALGIKVGLANWLYGVCMPMSAAGRWEGCAPGWLTEEPLNQDGGPETAEQLDLWEADAAVAVEGEAAPAASGDEPSGNTRQLTWIADTDNDNRIFSALSCQHNDSVSFEYRIEETQPGEEYVLCSDPELMLEGDDTSVFATLEEAQAYCQQREDEAYAAAVAEAERVCGDCAYSIPGESEHTCIFDETAPLVVQLSDTCEKWHPRDGDTVEPPVLTYPEQGPIPGYEMPADEPEDIPAEVGERPDDSPLGVQIGDDLPPAVAVDMSTCQGCGEPTPVADMRFVSADNMVLCRHCQVDHDTADVPQALFEAKEQGVIPQAEKLPCADCGEVYFAMHLQDGLCPACHTKQATGDDPAWKTATCATCAHFKADTTECLWRPDDRPRITRSIALPEDDACKQYQQTEEATPAA